MQFEVILRVLRYVMMLGKERVVRVDDWDLCPAYVLRFCAPDTSPPRPD